MPRPSRLLTVAVSSASALALLASAALAVPPDPAQFSGPLEAYAGYEGETACDPVDKPGVVGFRELVAKAYPGTPTTGGISRACSASTSEHEEGRAWDWMLDAADPVEHARADEVFAWLFEPDAEGRPHARARRLGIMYIIWDSQIWKAFQADKGWQPYSGWSPHTDHVHFSFSRAGAGAATSWWPQTHLDGPGGAVPQPRDVADACPAGEVPRSRWTDVPAASAHAPAVDCASWWDVLQGASTTAYAPERPMTRATMAQSVAATIEASGGTLPAAPPDAFDDDEDLPAGVQLAIDQLAAVGVVKGSGPRTYSPAGTVTRAQMASYLVRAFEQRTRRSLPLATVDYFGDDDRDVHAPRIGSAARTGITGGTTTSTYGPSQATTRGQMASFLTRLLDLLVDAGAATPPEE